MGGCAEAPFSRGGGGTKGRRKLDLPAEGRFSFPAPGFEASFTPGSGNEKRPLPRALSFSFGGG